MLPSIYDAGYTELDPVIYVEVPYLDCAKAGEVWEKMNNVIAITLMNNRFPFIHTKSSLKNNI